MDQLFREEMRFRRYAERVESVHGLIDFHFV